MKYFSERKSLAGGSSPATGIILSLIACLAGPAYAEVTWVDLYKPIGEEYAGTATSAIQFSINFDPLVEDYHGGF